jgi:hypothetical protein
MHLDYYFCPFAASLPAFVANVDYFNVHVEILAMQAGEAVKVRRSH